MSRQPHPALSDDLPQTRHSTPCLVVYQVAASPIQIRMYSGPKGIVCRECSHRMSLCGVNGGNPPVTLLNESVTGKPDPGWRNIPFLFPYSVTVNLRRGRRAKANGAHYPWGVLMITFSEYSCCDQKRTAVGRV